MNLDPLPGVDWTEISPPMASASILQIVRPRPTPSVFISLNLLILVKAVNSSLSFEGSMPTPVSTTLILILPLKTEAFTLIYPSLVYLMALEIKFIKICCVRTSSRATKRGTFSGIWDTKLTLLKSALNFRMSMQS